jgi:hypothetical protein
MHPIKCNPQHRRTAHTDVRTLPNSIVSTNAGKSLMSQSAARAAAYCRGLPPRRPCFMESTTCSQYGNIVMHVPAFDSTAYDETSRRTCLSRMLLVTRTFGAKENSAPVLSRLLCAEHTVLLSYFL